MQQLTTNEAYYRRVVNALGIGLLFFLLFLLLMSLAVGTLQIALDALPLSDTAAKVTYQLIYGALYLAVFMCPVPIMRAFLRGQSCPGSRCAPQSRSPAACP